MNAFRRPRLAAPLLCLALTTAAGSALVATAASPARASTPTVFISSAVEQGPTAAHPSGTVTLPLHHGTSRGRSVDYIITESSDGSVPGAGLVAKLANAAGTGAVQQVTVNADGSYDFPASVDFAPVREVAPGPNGFPPSVARPGAVAEAGYSPLVQLPNGTVINAPQLQNGTGRADKVVSVSADASHVTYEETAGFSGGKAVRYISTESSDTTGATLENVTYAPQLDSTPTVGDDSTASGRAELVAFTNGRTGVSNPQRQGLSSALLDGRDPLNVLAWTPNQGRYSPIWDVHLATWSDAAKASGQDQRQTDVGTVQGLADHGLIRSFSGAAFGPAGFIVNCPIISQS